MEIKMKLSRRMHETIAFLRYFYKRSLHLKSSHLANFISNVGY